MRAIVVIDLLSDTFAFAEVASEILLLLLVVVTQQLLPVVWIYALLLLDDLPLNLLLLSRGKERSQTVKKNSVVDDD